MNAFLITHPSVLLLHPAAAAPPQAAWHPGSSSHFAVLASDNRWRLYHTGRLTEAEQTFWLRLSGTQVRQAGQQHAQRGLMKAAGRAATC